MKDFFTLWLFVFGVGCVDYCLMRHFYKWRLRTNTRLPFGERDADTGAMLHVVELYSFAFIIFILFFQ